MGQLVDGIWQDIWYDTKSTGGRFKRSNAQFRNWVTSDGSAGPNNEPGFKAEKDRYHLYVSLACPWAHRTLLVRKLKGLETLIPVSVVSPLMLEMVGRLSAPSLPRPVTNSITMISLPALSTGRPALYRTRHCPCTVG